MNFEQWAALPTVAPYTWEVYRNSLLARAEVVVGSERHEPLTVIGDPPYTLVAVPHRAGLPRVEVQVVPGQKPIWHHCGSLAIPLGVGGEARHKEAVRYEYVVIGREHPNGLKEFWMIMPDGEVHDHNDRIVQPELVA